MALIRAHGARLIGPNCLGIAVSQRQPERHLRPARAASGHDRLLVAERRARARAPREGGRAQSRAFGIHLDRQQGRRLVERSPRVLGTGLADEPRTALSRVVREPAPLRADRAAGCAAQADPRHEERHDGLGRARCQLAHGGPRRIGSCSRGALPPGRRAQGGNPRVADRRRHPPLNAASPTRPPGGDPDERGRPRDPRRRRVRRGGTRAPRAPPRHGLGPLDGPSQQRRASPIRWTCWARLPPRRTGWPCPSYSRTHTWTA